MATNKVQDGKILRLTVGAAIDSGDPVVVGNALRGVALTDYDSADGCASVELGPAVYDLSVTATDDAGNSAVALGDRLYTDGTTITKKKSGKFFGIALEAVSSGQTGTINVYIAGPSGADQIGLTAIDGGNHTVAASPAPDTTEDITPNVPILSTDLVQITMKNFQGAVDSPFSVPQIVGYSITESPDTITVTAAAAFTAGDVITWTVFRAGV